MAKLTGTNPGQTPTNADLGDMAYKDGENLQAGPLTITDGKVGIGDVSPSYKLDVVGNAQLNPSSNPVLRFSESGTVRGLLTSSASIGLGIETSGALPFRVNTNGSERMRIDSSGDVNIVNELIAGSYNETYTALSGTTPTVDCETGNSFSLTLSGNTTFTFSNPPASGTSYTFSIEIIQDASASGYTVTWDSAVDWPAATAPTLTATASAKDIFVFTTRDGGTNWYGFTAGQALA